MFSCLKIKLYIYAEIILNRNNRNELLIVNDKNMKKKAFFLITASIVCMVAGLSCNKTEEPAQPSIIGKWQYIRYESPNSEEDDLISPYLFIYNFKVHNVLTISIGLEDSNSSTGWDWSFNPNPHEWWTIRIDCWCYRHKVTAHELLLYDELGGIQYFVRIN